MYTARKSPPTMLVYDERPASTGSLMPALQDAFSAEGIFVEKTGLSDLRMNLKHTHLGFVLPGIIGADSPYPDHFSPDIIKAVHRKIENGMVGIFICAGAAFFSRETIYTPPWGAPKGRKMASPIFNGLARGPIPHLSKKPEDGIGDVSLAPVRYKQPNGSEAIARIYYGNGSYFIPDDPRDPNVDVIARFDDVENNPPAIIRVRKGKGFAYFMAVHPEIGPIAVSHDVTLPNDEQVRGFIKQLQTHESGRQELWGLIMADIINHHKKLGRQASPMVKRQP